MWLKTLYLRNFRNYKEALVEFAPGLNFFQGKNGQGKTNMLEAIYFLSTGRSFRTDRLQDLIRQNSDHFHIEALFVKSDVEQRVKVSYDGTTKQVVTNEQRSANFSSLLGLLPSVIASPSDMDLIMGAPATRRRFLNIHIAQTDPLYVYHLSRYNKALKQRNALLKAKKTETIEIFENEMVISANYILEKRRLHLSALNTLTQTELTHLSKDDEEVHLNYKSSFSQDFASALKKMRPKELLYGSTQIGPHRDEIEILHNNKPAKTFASEGQKQTLLSALRFAERQQMSSRHTGMPLFGIDDFGQHLDPIRTQLLKEQLTEGGQIFLTTPNYENDVENAFTIENGTISTTC